jgi:hypothetical protein
MVQFRLSVEKKLRRLQQNAPEHLLALGIALFLHTFIVAGINALIGARSISRSLRLQSVVFDLAPIHEKRFSAKEQSPPAGREAPARASQTAASPANENALPQPSTYVEASDFISATEVSGGPSSAEAAAFLPIAAPAPPLFNATSLTPKLIPRRLAMPASQRRVIVKKMTNFIGKTIAKTKLDSSFVWEKNGQRFQFDLNHLPASSATGFDELLVGVTTVEGGDTLATQFRMRRTAFSHFAQFVDYWDPRVALHNDEFDGRFHSNSAMVISSSNGTQPQFRGKVTTAGYSIRRAEERSFLDDSKVFLAGLEEGAAEIPLPRIFMGIPRDSSRSAGRIKIFSEESWITFHADGSYRWHTSSAPQRKQHAQLSETPYSIIGQSKARLHVKGVVNGKVLIYSENDIIINDDLLYARDPEISQSDDFLGLVSAKDIEIASPSVTGPGDLKVYAAVLARGSFRVPNLYTKQTGTLHIYGSLSAGSITATEPRYGTRIRFDQRFEKMRPPNFPMTNQYEIAEWDERWMVK